MKTFIIDSEIKFIYRNKHSASVASAVTRMGRSLPLVNLIFPIYGVGFYIFRIFVPTCFSVLREFVSDCGR